VNVEGLDHLPQDGGFVLAANHLSMADVPLLLTVMPRPTIVYASEELRTWPWLHWFLSDLGNAIYVRKGTGNERGLALGVTVLEAGGVVALGPEGRRSQTGALERANTGVAYLARGGNVPVVPVATWGQERIAASWRRLRRRSVHIRFGAPLTPPGPSAEPAELREFADGVMTEIARLLPAEYRGVYANAII
jgi:1-acyl-sn-glycerol-3-phosphate acyltransferase